MEGRDLLKMGRRNGWPTNFDEADLTDRLKLMIPELEQLVDHPASSPFFCSAQKTLKDKGRRWWDGDEGVLYRYESAHGG